MNDLSVVRLILPFPISKNRKTVLVRGVPHRSPEWRRYIEVVRAECLLQLEQGRPLFYLEEVEVEVTVRASNRRRFDVHNLEEVLFDALQGIVYADDCQIVKHTTTRGEVQVPAHVEVVIQRRRVDHE